MPRRQRFAPNKKPSKETLVAQKEELEEELKSCTDTGRRSKLLIDLERVEDRIRRAS